MPISNATDQAIAEKTTAPPAAAAATDRVVAEPDRVSWTRRHPRLVIRLAALALLCACVLALRAGAADLAPAAVLRWIMSIPGLSSGPVDPLARVILSEVRLPRILMGVVAGAGLAASGVLLQAFFRNPLADPALIGVSTGGAVGAVAVIVLGTGVAAPLVALLGSYALPVAAFLGSLGTTGIVYMLARKNGLVDPTTMLLAGIAVNAIAGAAIGLLIFMANDAELRSLTFWTLGSLSATSWFQLGPSSLATLALVAAIPFLAWPLNALLLGEAEAQHLGIAVERLKKIIIVLACVVTGTITAAVGVIAFVGLIAPHFARLLVGPDHRAMMWLATLLGAMLMVLADVAARTMAAPAELPIGVLTALVGGPLFLWLLRRAKGSLFNA